jgi:hypothetical protein
LQPLLTFEGGGNSPTYPPQNGGIAVASCNGALQTVRLTNASAQLLNPTGRCSFGFEVAEGTVRFGNGAGSVGVWSPEGQLSGDSMRAVVTTAEAVTPAATLNFMLCPIEHPPVNWQCL